MNQKLHYCSCYFKNLGQNDVESEDIVNIYKKFSVSELHEDWSLSLPSFLLNFYSFS